VTRGKVFISIDLAAYHVGESMWRKPSKWNSGMGEASEWDVGRSAPAKAEEDAPR